MELSDSTVRSFIKRYNERGNLENLLHFGRTSISENSRTTENRLKKLNNNKSFKNFGLK